MPDGCQLSLAALHLYFPLWVVLPLSAWLGLINVISLGEVHRFLLCRGAVPVLVLEVVLDRGAVFVALSTV